ncbi:MAG: YdeI/OmpD-associated family protein [Pseudomonadota bacterium]
MITEIDDYFLRGCGRCARFATPECSTQRWVEGLTDLRRICVDLGLEETVKWGHPCYMHAGRNVAILGAFRSDFRMSFFDAGLLKDPEGILERQGPNTRYPDMIRFVSNDGVVRQEATIRAYLDEAMGYAQAGLREPKATEDLDLPEELVEGLAADPELSEAFDRLTPGRRTSYVINLRSAKKPETRHARIAGFRDKILAGKGALER